MGLLFRKTKRSAVVAVRLIIPIPPYSVKAHPQTAGCPYLENKKTSSYSNATLCSHCCSGYRLTIASCPRRCALPTVSVYWGCAKPASHPASLIPHLPDETHTPAAIKPTIHTCTPKRRQHWPRRYDCLACRAAQTTGTGNLASRNKPCHCGCTPGNSPGRVQN